MFGRFVFFWVRRIMGLRYRVEVRGLKKVREQLGNAEGVLFFSNHPALMDPIISTMTFWPKFKVRPLIIEYIYNIPLVHWFLKTVMNAISVPDFARGSNSYKRMLADRSLDAIVAGLESGDNFLVYPAGRLQRTPEEMLGGASAAFEIVQRVPDARIVLLRVRGLWGSLFGWGVTGEQPRLGPGFKKGFRYVLKNLIFFTPKRVITIDMEVADPPRVSRKEFNQTLEEWFNQPAPGAAGSTEALSLVSYSRWKQEFPVISYQRPFQDGDVDRVPEKVQKSVRETVARLAKREPAEIREDMHLFTDLGLDSLDIADLILSLPSVQGLPPEARLDMMTVGAVMALAAGEFTVGGPKEVEAIKGWMVGESRPDVEPPVGDRVYEAFLRCADRMGKSIACADGASGVRSYQEVKRAALVLAEHLRKLPGEKIGIMLPASCGAMIATLAIQLAGKVPVMINWTVGVRYLETVKEVAGVQVVLTSEQFLGQLDGANITPIHDQILTFEQLRKQLTLGEKWRGSRLARKSADQVLKTIGVNTQPAVILFTSGTEALPKAVPLSHDNILSNLRSATPLVGFSKSDILFSILPPFHSLGFTVTSLFPLVIGGKVFFSPDPTDGAGLAREIAAYRATIFCAAPTFLKGVKRSSRPKQLETLRLIVTGAEKASQELFDWVASMPQAELIEGYGITECSPILTLNRPGDELRGVGKPIDTVELCIVHPETHDLLSQGDVGLILARGAGIFSGYLGPQADPFITLEGEPWYNTGDLGRLDEVGALHLAGRLKRFVKMGGEMISLPALEVALEGVFEEQIAVIAHEREGERPELHLFSTEELGLDQVNEALREAGMGNLAKISRVHRLDYLPLMGTGKIHLRKLEEISADA